MAYAVMRYLAGSQAEREDIDIGNSYCTGNVGVMHRNGRKRDRNSDISSRLCFGAHKRGSSHDKNRIYLQAVKPALDRILSFGGLVLLAPVFAVVSTAVYLDDPGPVLFTQKRVGKDGHFFELHKFRTMKLSTPHDVPTHQLRNPEQYITKIGHMLRRTSLDELPQIWDIFRGKMSIIGPRPALWNQEDLVAEREKYGANEILPGLTGWAQINGRDELEIPAKAKLDGEYVEYLRQGGAKALFFDVKCFAGTIRSVACGRGVVEGGTGTLHGNAKSVSRPDESIPVDLAEDLNLVPSTYKGQLITTFNSCSRELPHGHGNIGVGVAGGERDLQFPRRYFGILKEEFIEIAHTVKEQGVGIVLLDPEVLLKHRCEAGGCVVH